MIIANLAFLKPETVRRSARSATVSAVNVSRVRRQRSGALLGGRFTVEKVVATFHTFLALC
jgi:hypothetical protein